MPPPVPSPTLAVPYKNKHTPSPSSTQKGIILTSMCLFWVVVIVLVIVYVHKIKANTGM